MFFTAATPAGTMGRLSSTECTYLPNSPGLRLENKSMWSVKRNTSKANEYALICMF